MSKKNKRTNRHHRKSRSRHGDSSPRNISIVNEKDHCAFHCLFHDTHPVAIAKLLTDVWLDPDYILVAVPKDDARQVLKHLSQLVH